MEQKRSVNGVERDVMFRGLLLPLFRDPSWRSEGPSKEREHTGSESSRTKGNLNICVFYIK